MQVELDATGRRVWIWGAPHAARRAMRRWSHAGAVVRPFARPHDAQTQLHAAAGESAPYLVVAVDDGQPQWRDLIAQLPRNVLVAHESAAAPGGQVVLVGGGPGSPGLMTHAATETLAQADVVLVDRLAPREGLEELTGGAELIDVGKRPGHHRMTQTDIEGLMMDRALSGQTVVRLKGGDPYVFGRGSEEVATLRAVGIPVTVHSGVTSALAVPGAEGIPVTHREQSRLFTVISGHDPLSAQEVQHLAGLNGTIVVLMGVGTMQQTVSDLLRAGMDGKTPLAVVQHGFRSTQRSVYGTLEEAATTGLLTACQSPAVLVIGSVVRHGRGWHEEVERALAHAQFDSPKK